jgi:ABC-type polysaccharide/polyol phosphate export permease
MLGFLLFLIVYAVTTHFSLSFILIIPVLLCQFVFSLGLGMLLAGLTPYIRDIGQILGYVLQAVFFLSPIIYSIESVPEQLRFIFYFNPITYFASSYHSIILLHTMPPLHYFGVIVSLAAISFLTGFIAFRKLQDGFADVL